MVRNIIVFDLDDTLFAEREFVRSGFRAVGAWLERERGVTGFAHAAQDVFERGGRGRIFDAALPRVGLAAEPELIARLVAIYREHEPQLTLLPDARRTLAVLQGRARLGLITDGYAPTQRRKIAALTLERWFEHLICTDEFGRDCWKPSAMAFERMMAQFGCRGDVCVYVGDNPAKDFVAPNRLGWLTVRIRRAGSEHAAAGDDHPAVNQAQVEIRSLDELAGVLAAQSGAPYHVP